MPCQQFSADDTIVDEDLVLTLTKTPSTEQTLLEESLLLDDDEHGVLGILEQLEDYEQSNNDQTYIDNDSILAPLTQSNHVVKITQSQQGNDPKVDVSFDGSDSDDDFFNNFSMSMVECIGDQVEETDELWFVFFAFLIR